jgi:hypothetical protein
MRRRGPCPERLLPIAARQDGQYLDGESHSKKLKRVTIFEESHHCQMTVSDIGTDKGTDG